MATHRPAGGDGDGADDDGDGAPPTRGANLNPNPNPTPTPKQVAAHFLPVEEFGAAYALAARLGGPNLHARAAQLYVKSYQRGPSTDQPADWPRLAGA